MSSISFHTADDRRVRVSGAERAHMGLLCQRLCKGFLDYRAWPYMPDDALSRLTELVPLERRQGIREQRLSPAEMAGVVDGLISGFGGTFEWRGRPVNGSLLCLNTTIALGSDPVVLCARLHGQCEIHAFVEGPDRAWLADVVDEGRDSGVLRADARGYDGWSAVSGLLREDASSPVVTSYSVTESFPNPYVVGASDEESRDRFWGMPRESQWEAAMSAIRQSDRGLRLDPGEWSTYRFGRGLTAMDVLADDWRRRLDEYVGV